MRAVPDVGAMIVDSIRSVVVFPAPFAPRRPNTSLSRHSKLMPSTARMGPRDSSRKVFVRLQTATGAATGEVSTAKASSTVARTPSLQGSFQHETVFTDNRGGEPQRDSHEH